MTTVTPTALDPQPQEEQKDASESSELSRLRAELAGALAEMETMKAVAEVSESTKAEAVAAVQRQCQEEVASLQAILKGEEPATNTPTLQPVCLHPSNGECGMRKASNELQVAQQRKDCVPESEYPFLFCRETPQVLSATLVSHS